jgi:glucan phosphoethanolaminetransferase (alkaline phosphatase superfamily)
MGTAGDWALVVFVAMVCGLFLPLRALASGRKLSDREVWAASNFIPSFFYGVWIGILIAFHWRAFRWPLIPITVAALIVAGIAMSGKLHARAVR